MSWRSSVLLRLVRGLALCALVLVGRAAFAAAPLDPKDAPEPLRPWTRWVLDGKESSLCPFLDGSGEDRRCAWPARLRLTLEERGGRFSQGFRVDAKRWVSLPGDEKRWPQDVSVDGKRAVVTTQSGAPSVELSRGEHTVTGAFVWDTLPESVRVPKETGLVSLVVRGVSVPIPNRDGDGHVWLQKSAGAEDEGERLDVVVHRRIVDDVPLLLTTRIQLNVAGKNREITLGRALPDGFLPMTLSSPLPARLEPDSRLRIQVRPGTFVIELVARHDGAVNALRRPAPDGPWREGDEVWVFEARPDLRLVTVEGVPAIDPQQTTLPPDWKRLPTYPMKLSDTLQLAEKRRGDAEPPPNHLTLSRTLWLDFAGTGYTVSDSLAGNLHRGSRLEMAAPSSLGRVSIRGTDQFITKLGDGARAGVEVRGGELSVAADSRIEGDIRDIPAVGWNHDFHQVSAVLHLPPGWRLFHASGVDDVPETWLRHWSLLELFLVLIVALSFGRLYGWAWGGVALVMLALTFPEDGAPKWAWLALLCMEALTRVVSHAKARPVFVFGRLVALVVVTLLAVPFLVTHVREGLYPALARPTSAHDGFLKSDASDEEEAGQTGGRAPPPPAVAEPAANAVAATEAPLDQDGVGDDKPVGDLNRDQKQVVEAKPVPKAKPAPSPKLAGGISSRASSYDFKSNAETYDPTVAVQTGPGVPRWSWGRASLRFSGPVESGQRVHLSLLSPPVNLVLALLRAALLVLLVLRTYPWTARFFGGGARPPAVVVAGAILLATLLAPASARADLPSKEMLDELQRRLLATPECRPSCASSPRLLVEIRPGSLRARVEIDASATTAVPLPGTAAQWTPSEVTLDGRPAAALLRADDGKLWIAVEPGAHQVVLEGPMPARDTLQLALHLKPHRVEARAEGWTVEGVHEDGLSDDTLQFTRIRTDSPQGGALQAGNLPPFVRVERTLQLGLDWQIETRVVRVTPTGSAVVAEVPLLPGESVTTADVRVVSGKAMVNMGVSAAEVRWRSVLEQRSPVRLVAPKGAAWTEVWRLDLGPIWHVEPAGIPAVHARPSSGARVPEWRPWPGEDVTLTVTRPEGVGGQTLTLDQTTYEVRPGLRSTDATVTMRVRSSRGTQHALTLPAGAQLESLTVNGVAQPLRQEGRKITVPVAPGAQTVELAWREPTGIGLAFRTPALDLGVPSVNTTTQVTGLTGRWLLFLHGPRLGPVVLFWSLALVLVVLSALLGRIRATELRWHDWLLLNIGLSQVHVVAAAVVVGWLLVLGLRRHDKVVSAGPARFNLVQVALVGWTLVALTLLGVAVRQGLLGAPEMQVQGNGATADSLRWFSDRSEPLLEGSLIVSAPLLVYRGAMLAWALWVALAVLRWLRWGWASFTTGGAWRSFPSRPRPPHGPPHPQGAYPQYPPSAAVAPPPQAAPAAAPEVEVPPSEDGGA